MPRFAFGNNPDKIARYRAFWGRDDVARPLMGFTLAGWFPLEEFAACRAWRSTRYLEPGMIQPREFLADHLRILKEGEIIDDDLIRGACPAQLAFPWLPGILGCCMRVLPGTIAGEEMCLDWDRALETRVERESAWYGKYMEFAAALAEASAGRFPVSHGAEVGPTDLHALLRGHSQSVMDLSDAPEESARLLGRLGEILRDITEDLWRRLPRFEGGYFDAQYSLWAPGPIIRMQEDATAIYSPALYRRFVQPVDRTLARHFEYNFIHLHSTSMFLLDAFLEIEEIRCFEVNKDELGPPVTSMIPHFQKIQRAGRPLIIRGLLTQSELREIMDSLEPRGLFLNVMAKSMDEIGSLRRIAEL